MNIMTSSLEGFFKVDIALVSNLLLGVLMTIVGIKGMKSLTVLANVSMPFLIMTIGLALFNSTGKSLSVSSVEGLTLSGTSLTLACGIAAVIDLPTFFRLAKTKKDGILAACLLFGLVIPLVESVGLYLFMQAKGENIIEALAQESSPFIWKIWTICFLLLAGWTTNNANLYSATVSLQTITPKISEPVRTIIIGILGTALSCMNLLDHLVSALDLIGIVLGSMGAVIVFCLAFKQSNNHKENILVWAIGVLGGGCSYFGFSLLQIPVLDAFTSALMTKILLKVIKNEKIVSIRSG